MHVLCTLPQLFVWKEVDYGGMSEREKQLLVQEVNLLRGHVSVVFVLSEGHYQH